ncbi:hypothetical protein D3C78_654920 [compost metagenome]
MLEQDQPLPGRQQDQQADHQLAERAAPVAAGFRIAQHEDGRRAPPEHPQHQHQRRQGGHEVEPVEQCGDQQAIGDAQGLGGKARQARPFPAAETDDGADEQGEGTAIQPEEAGKGDGQQHQGGDDALFQHLAWASASSCSPVLPKRRCRLA